MSDTEDTQDLLAALRASMVLPPQKAEVREPTLIQNHTSWCPLCQTLEGFSGDQCIRCYDNNAATARNTKGLKPGWYVANGFFWHRLDVRTYAGPFTTQNDAMECRSALERIQGQGRYYIDEVEA